MKILSGEEERNAIRFLIEARTSALESTCERSCCGSIIVSDKEIIGRGFNSPPRNLEGQRRCSCSKDSYHRKVTDKTCCVHAEQRAMIDALIKNSQRISGSRLYFVRLDSNGAPKRSGEPYCTICSKMALDVGIGEFVLWQEKGICVYGTEEYNELSFAYRE